MPVNRVMCALILFFLLFFPLGCTRKDQHVSIPNGSRIISLSPAATSILLELSLAQNLAGIDRWSASLPGIPPHIPSFDMIHPDAEHILALEPDIIFVSTMTRDATGSDPFAPFSGRGVSIIYIPVSVNLEAIKSDVRLIAQTCDVHEKGEEVVQTMESAISAIKMLSTAVSEETRKSVYMEIGAGSVLYSFGRDVYLDELIVIAGGYNIFNDRTGWLAVNAEQVLERNPAIILTNVPVPGAAAEIVARPGWETITAVRTQSVYEVDHARSSQPAPAITGTLREIARALYPDNVTGGK